MTQHFRAEAQAAVAALEECAYRLLRSNPRGLRTGEVAALLGIESHVPARNSNWLTRTILEQLVVSGRVISVKAGNARLFRAANPAFKRSSNGRPPGPVWRYAIHFVSSGQSVLPPRAG